MTSHPCEGLADAAAVATDAAADAAAVAAPAAKDNGGFLGGAINLIESSISVIHKVRRQYRDKAYTAFKIYMYIVTWLARLKMLKVIALDVSKRFWQSVSGQGRAASV